MNIPQKVEYRKRLITKYKNSSLFGLRTKSDRLYKYKILTLLFFMFIALFTPLYTYAADNQQLSDDVIYSMPKSDSLMGDASSSVPIVVPPGRNGIEPNLALTYSSSNKRSGVVGAGWNLNISYIQRNTQFGLDYTNNEDNNPFIVSMEGASGELVSLGSGNYGLEIEGAFYRFYFNTGSNYWEVTSKDGTKYYFGLNVDHNNNPTNSRHTYPSDSTRVYKWCLDKVVDTNGNYMEIEYDKSYNDNEIYLKEIRYTGNDNTSFDPVYTVRFNLTDRGDLVPYFNPGFRVVTSKLIKTIEVLYGSTLVRAYSLNYDVNPDSNKSLLTSIQQYGSDASFDSNGDLTGSTLPPMTFTYYDDPITNITPTSVYLGLNAFYNYSAAGDFNGDGKADLLAIESNCLGGRFYYILMSNGDGTFGAAIELNNYINNEILNVYADVIPGDFNGDGLTDIIVKPNADNNNTGAYVYYSTGDGVAPFSGSPQMQISSGLFDWRVRPLDFNGDGMMDLSATYSDDIDRDLDAEHRIYINNGNGTFSAPFDPFAIYDNDNTVPDIFGRPSYSYEDFNGDGKTDIILTDKPVPEEPWNVDQYILLSDGAGSFQYVDQPVYHFINLAGRGDFNGDGLTDLVVGQKIAFSKGDGTFYESIPDSTISNYNSDNPYTYRHLLTGDFNGDGLCDIIVSDVNSTSNARILRLFLSNGDGSFRDTGITWNIFSVVIPDLAAFCTGQVFIPAESVITIGDFNGDARSEIMYLDDLTQMKIRSFGDAFEPMPDMIHTISNGKGGATAFDYQVATQYNNNLMPMTPYLVSSITISDGNDGSYTTSYGYEGGRYDYVKREFLGYKYIDKTNPDDSYEVTEYLQGHYTKNRPLKTFFYDSEGGALRIKTDYTWDTYPSTPTTWAFVKLNQKKTTYENNASYFTQDNYTYDDTNGFPVNVVKSGTNANGQAVEQVTQYTAYNQYPSNSWAWRVTEESVTGATTGLSRKMTYGYNNYGNMTSKTFWRTASTEYPAMTYTHDGFGNVLTETDGLNHTTTIDYETATYTYSWHITNAKNHVTTKTWDYKFGKEDTVTDPNNNTTDYNYDLFGRIANIYYPGGGYTENIYTNYDQVTFPRYITTRTLESGSIGSGSYIEKSEYFDGLDRSIKVITDGIDAQEPPASIEIITTTHYDDMGRKSEVYGPYFANEGETSRYYEDTEYDKLGRVTYIKSPSSITGQLSTIGYTYPNPFTTVITDPDNMQKTEKRDHLGRIIEVIEHANTGNQSTTYAYNAAGDMTRVWNALYNSSQSNVFTSITYDARGLKTSMNDPDMGAWSYAYDENGNLWTQTDAKQNIITFNYDELNRVYNKIYSIPASEPQNTPNVEYRYDGYGLSSCTNCIGQLTSVNNTNVLTKYDLFDPMGRVKKVTKTIAGDQPRTTETFYDLSGKVTDIIHPDGFVVHNTYYSGTGLLDTVTRTVSGVSTDEYAKCTEYEPTGKIGRITHTYNDTETVYSYDLKTTRLTDLLTTGQSGNIQHKSYTYSDAGDINEIKEYNPDGSVKTTYTYSYDNLHRLIDEVTSDTSLPTSAEVLIYTYNNNNKPNAVRNINYNGNNYPFDYDANGNMVEGWDFTNPNSIVERDLTWNADNMPVIVTRNGITTNLTYDGDGVRAKKVAGGITTYYISNDYEIKNGVVTKYVFAGNLRVASIEGTNNTKIYHKDHLGSSVAITDSTAGSIETSEYLPFGGMRAHTGAGGSDYKYTDQELDSESNLYNYDARLYDQNISRFVSADTIVPEPFNPQSLNRYSYVLNNPLIYTDPSGHANEYSCENGECLPEIIVHGNRYTRWQDPSMTVIAGTSLVGELPRIAEIAIRISPSIIRGVSYVTKVSGLATAILIAIDAPAVNSEPDEVIIARMLAEEKAKEKAKEGLDVDKGRERTPDTNPEDYDNVKNSPAKRDKNTGEIWKKDKFHKNHWEVYKNRKDFENKHRDRSVWDDGRFKEKF